MEEHTRTLVQGSYDGRWPHVHALVRRSVPVYV